MRPTPEQVQDQFIDHMMMATSHGTPPTAEDIQDRLIDDCYATVPTLAGIRNVIDMYETIIRERRMAAADAAGADTGHDEGTT